jgi:hypothetical protein
LECVPFLVCKKGFQYICGVNDFEVGDFEFCKKQGVLQIKVWVCVFLGDWNLGCCKNCFLCVFFSSSGCGRQQQLSWRDGGCSCCA